MSHETGVMTEAMYLVLLALSKSNHGYGLKSQISDMSNGRVVMGPGTMYGVLSRLNKAEYISLVEDNGRKKTYKITDKGLHALLEEYKRLKELTSMGTELEQYLSGDARLNQ